MALAEHNPLTWRMGLHGRADGRRPGPSGGARAPWPSRRAPVAPRLDSSCALPWGPFLGVKGNIGKDHPRIDTISKPAGDARRSRTHPDGLDRDRMAMIETVWQACYGTPAWMHPAPTLDQYAEPGLGARLDAIAIGIVDIKGLLSVIPGLDLGRNHPSPNHVLMGRLEIIHLEGGVVGRRRWGVVIFDDVYHGAAGQLKPVQVVAIDHFGDLPQPQDILLVLLQRRILVLDVVGDVVNVFQTNVVRQHTISFSV
jgi:hypothetical protein